MKRTLIIVGLVAALAIPTAAVAAGHRSTPKAKSRSVATTPKTKAKGSAPRSGLAVTVRIGRRREGLDLVLVDLDGKTGRGGRACRPRELLAGHDRHRTAAVG